ncbi:hypothetical protein TNCV_3057691 [Trichonephila clavipes]|nr:hypothetical protein TNCV_3057691 [Trichonephila clavipes]
MSAVGCVFPPYLTHFLWCPDTDNAVAKEYVERCILLVSISKYFVAVCLPSRNTWAPIPYQQNVPYILVIPPDPCTGQVRQGGFMALWGSRRIQRLS